MSTAKTTYTEQILIQLLAEKKSEEPGTFCVSRKKSVFKRAGHNVRADLFACGEAGATLYEVKAGDSKAEHLHQLLMYYNSCLANGESLRSAILIARHHPKEVRLLVSELNRRKGADVQQFRLGLSTWASEGITPSSSSI